MDKKIFAIVTGAAGLLLLLMAGFTIMQWRANEKLNAKNSVLIEENELLANEKSMQEAELLAVKEENEAYRVLLGTEGSADTSQAGELSKLQEQNEQLLQDNLRILNENSEVESELAKLKQDNASLQESITAQKELTLTASEKLEEANSELSRLHGIIEENKGYVFDAVAMENMGVLENHLEEDGINKVIYTDELRIYDGMFESYFSPSAEYSLSCMDSFMEFYYDIYSMAKKSFPVLSDADKEKYAFYFQVDYVIAEINTTTNLEAGLLEYIYLQARMKLEIGIYRYTFGEINADELLTYREAYEAAKTLIEDRAVSINFAD